MIRIDSSENSYYLFREHLKKGDMRILKIYKNRIYESIARAGLDPCSFEAREDEHEGPPLFCVKVKGAPLSFAFVNPPEDYHSFDYIYERYSSNFAKVDSFGRYTEFDGVKLYYDFKGVLKKFEEWLERHVDVYFNELVEPDLWQSSVQAVEESFGASSSAGRQELYSERQIEELRFSVLEFKRRIIEEFAPTETQAKEIDAQLEYLSESLSRLNKFDWRGVLLNTVISIIITLCLDTNRGNQLLKIFKQVFMKVVYLLQ